MKHWNFPDDHGQDLRFHQVTEVRLIDLKQEFWSSFEVLAVSLCSSYEHRNMHMGVLPRRLRDSF
jgi:hypothetical protein